MNPLKIYKNTDILVVGTDISLGALKTHDCIIWGNKGLYGVIVRELVLDMVRHFENMEAHPRNHIGTRAALVFHWDQTKPLTNKKFRF